MVSQLHQKYEWLMFFSVAKVIGLYKMLQLDESNMASLVEEMGLLLVNSSDARRALNTVVKVHTCVCVCW